MRISTWNKDSHGLYDYESTQDNYKTEQNYIDASTIIYRDINSTSNLNAITDPLTTLQLKSEARHLRDSVLAIATVSIDRKENAGGFKFEPHLKHEGEKNSYDPTRTFYKVIRENNPETSTSEGFPLSKFYLT